MSLKRRTSHVLSAMVHMALCPLVGGLMVRMFDHLLEESSPPWKYAGCFFLYMLSLTGQTFLVKWARVSLLPEIPEQYKSLYQTFDAGAALAVSYYAKDALSYGEVLWPKYPSTCMTTVQVIGLGNAIAGTVSEALSKSLSERVCNRSKHGVGSSVV